MSNDQEEDKDGDNFDKMVNAANTNAAALEDSIVFNEDAEMPPLTSRPSASKLSLFSNRNMSSRKIFSALLPSFLNRRSGLPRYPCVPPCVPPPPTNHHHHHVRLEGPHDQVGQPDLLQGRRWYVLLCVHFTAQSFPPFFHFVSDRVGGFRRAFLA